MDKHAQSASLSKVRLHDTGPSRASEHHVGLVATNCFITCLSTRSCFDSPWLHVTIESVPTLPRFCCNSSRVSVLNCIRLLLVQHRNADSALFACPDPHAHPLSFVRTLWNNRWYC
ncbi:uncharacterized protein EKO05_0002989 [Ascochyta rabiei]|uniref:uncharacterized protein n=1 Tax=Didymella rabiei TaxID=5454 RepID=UPI002201D861|nr:uncharacterized protein EKO05_0002989 [Ascochyta rabiei]UPX12442.1 hypothetical protein EKO05_0002989 [Ascochyta rabiei]